MRALLLLLLALVGGVAALAYLAFDARPAVQARNGLEGQDISTLKALLRQNDPRRAVPGSLQQLRLSEAQANRLLDRASLYPALVGARLQLAAGRMAVNASLRTPATPFGRYLNLHADLAQTPTGGLQLRHLQVGRLPVPGLLADPLAHLAWHRLVLQPDFGSILQAIEGIRLAPHTLTVSYRWTPQLLARLEQQSAALVLDASEQDRLLGYERELRRLLQPYPPGSRLPLAALIGPLFRYAHSRGGDAVLEDRAAWLALSAYVTGVSLPHILKGQGHRRAPDVVLSLHGRQDAAEHYLVAAALAATAGQRLAEGVGLAKEEEDLLHGSGFSFTDLGWDLAGARVGQASTQANAAPRVQALLAAARSDGDLSPSFRDLPEFLGAAAFRRRYERIGSLAYDRVLEEINRRLDHHPLTGATIKSAP